MQKVNFSVINIPKMPDICVSNRHPVYEREQVSFSPQHITNIIKGIPEQLWPSGILVASGRQGSRQPMQKIAHAWFHHH